MNNSQLPFPILPQNKSRRIIFDTTAFDKIFVRVDKKDAACFMLKKSPLR